MNPFYYLLLFLCAFCCTPIFSQNTFRDEFNTVSYTNNDGTAAFTGPWLETNDTDLGPTAQNIIISGERLTFNFISTESISRGLNLNGATSASYSFDYQASSLVGGRGLLFQVSGDGGSSWASISAISGSNTSGTQARSSRK